MFTVNLKNIFPFSIWGIFKCYPHAHFPTLILHHHITYRFRSIFKIIQVQECRPLLNLPLIKYSAVDTGLGQGWIMCHSSFLTFVASLIIDNVGQVCWSCSSARSRFKDRKENSVIVPPEFLVSCPERNPEQQQSYIVVIHYNIFVYKDHLLVE